MLSFVIQSAIILSVAIFIVILVLLCGVLHFIVMLSVIMPDIVMLSVAFFIAMLCTQWYKSYLRNLALIYSL